jgi:hydroxyacylglutathione hydrolase
MTFKQNNPVVHLFPLKVVKDPFINYAYFLWDSASNEALIVDPGYGAEMVAAYVAEKKAMLKGVLLTHHHADHAHAASWIAGHYHVPVFMSKMESEYYHFSCQNLVPVSWDDCFSVGSFDVIAWNTPGHTKGSVCLQIDNRLFTGDTLFIEGCGICTGDGADPADMFRSLQKLKQIISSSVRIFPGHSFGEEPGMAFSNVLKDNLYFHLHDFHKFIAFRMRTKNVKFFL